MQIHRLIKNMPINELNLGIAREEQVLDLGLIKCKLANLQKRCWEDNQLGELVGVLRTEHPNQS